MCGINLWVWKEKSCEICQGVFSRHLGSSEGDIEKNDMEFRCDNNLRRRGPDSYGKVSSVTYPGFFQIQCAASVLQMRADLTEQPVSFVPAWTNTDERDEGATQSKTDDVESDEQRAYLCWNGEIYQQIQSHMSEQIEPDKFNSEETFKYDISDTTMVANDLRRPMQVNDDVINIGGGTEEQYNSDLTSRRASAQHHHIANVMSRWYNAEFAFCVLTEHGVYFGRDLWGRRSLLRWDCPRDCGSFQIVSVAENLFPSTTATPPPAALDGSPGNINATPSLEWKEVSPGAVHYILFSDPTENVPEIVYPKVSFPISRLPKDFSIPSIPQEVGAMPLPAGSISERLWRVSLELEYCLRKAVTIRLDQSSRRRSTGVLFSGGVDSVVLAALAADVLSSQYRAEKRAKVSSKSESRTRQSPSSQSHKQCLPVPILYLYNVSFGPDPEKSADRRAALESYNALRETYERTVDDDCGIKIIFRDIVVDWHGICQSESHIRTLISPKSTVMDVNIATALWFASGGRAVGNQTLNDNDFGIDSERSPRVLLLGMGADELMGGYGRHRKAYERGGWKELKAELTMDQDRLWERNCGRDDRLCSDHGREARFPFLDAHVVRLLQETMTNEDGLICDFGLPPGVGDKRILRIVAKRLGMEHASGLVKRAIQFGSRISHVSDKKRFGSRRKAKGATKI